MNEKLQAYIEKKKAENRAQFESLRDSRLIAAGLFEKRFSPTNKADDPEYPHVHWNKEEQRASYYKKVPIAVTDEEYQQFLEVTPEKPVEESTGANGVASALRGIAITLYILAGLTGLILLFINALAGIALMLSGFVSGTLFLGFAEIIKLLQKLCDK